MKKIKIGTISDCIAGKAVIYRNYLGEEFSTIEI